MWTIERVKVDTSEARTAAAYIKALGGRIEGIADFVDERLVVGRLIRCCGASAGPSVAVRGPA